MPVAGLPLPAVALWCVPFALVLPTKAVPELLAVVAEPLCQAVWPATGGALPFVAWNVPPVVRECM